MIMDRLVSILKHKFLIQGEINEDLKGKMLTGTEIGLNAMELYQFLICVEKEFHICFTSKDIYENGFCSLYTLEHLIVQKYSE